MTDDATRQDLLRRIDRIESQLAIQQLPIRYALAIDGRDLDAWVGLFVADVNCGRRGRGRAVLRAVIEPQVRTFYRSIHQICGHADRFRRRRITRPARSIAAPNTKRAASGSSWRSATSTSTNDVTVAGISRGARNSTGIRRTCSSARASPLFQNWDAWPDAQPELPHAFPTWKDFWEAGDKSLPGALSSAP